MGKRGCLRDSVSGSRCFPGEQFGENRDKQLTTGRDNPTRFLPFIFLSSNSIVPTICIKTELKERKLRIAFQHYVRWITVCCKGAQSTGLCFDTTTKRPSWWIWFLWDQMKSWNLGKKNCWDWQPWAVQIFLQINQLRISLTHQFLILFWKPHCILLVG